MSKSLALLQPAYLPWIGYFDKAVKADVLVHYDTSQYVSGTFLNRNFINAMGDKLMLTVPIISAGLLGQRICETEIDRARKWQKKHCLSIEQAYKKAPYYGQFVDVLHIIADRHSTLSSLSIEIIEFFMEIIDSTLGREQERHTASDLLFSGKVSLSGSATQNIVELCLSFDCDRYITGLDSQKYLDEAMFAANGITIDYRQIGRNLKHPVYNQLHGNFIPNLAILDFVFNVGMDFVEAIADIVCEV